MKVVHSGICVAVKAPWGSPKDTWRIRTLSSIAIASTIE